jgi:murein DD-endopeptidase MepM/ murein hydrolase activator NlpD
MPVIVLFIMLMVIGGLVLALIQLTKSDVVHTQGVLQEVEQQAPPTVTVVNQVDEKARSSGNYLLPDSSFINSPTAVGFDVTQVLSGTYLENFQQDYLGVAYTGVQMIERTALGHSIHPKLLLAVIEYQSGWVTASNAGQIHHQSGIGLADSSFEGFYQELYWAADQMAYGYYARRVGALEAVGLKDGTLIRLPQDMNPGSVGVYYFFSKICDQVCWEKAIDNGGFLNTYLAMFGDPYAGSVEPLLPSNLTQPTMQLPFEDGKVWSFTGGPHPAWGDGSAWAALDFAPPKEELGCIPTEEWITAVANGVIVRSEPALVMLDLDGDGFEQTGWNILYYHVETADRIPVGTVVKAGDGIGHPSCEGGISTGTHVHIARKYNGEWIPADQDIPFNLDGWISSGSGSMYDGFLTRFGEQVEALDGKEEENQISR